MVDNSSLDVLRSLVVGIGGRSGSGKTTIVQQLLEYYGPDWISLHTMDNYYLPRHMQLKDEETYLNFDLPTSFYRDRFANDLTTLKKGKDVRIEEYVYNNEKEPGLIHVPARPIILVEGLFIFHYQEVWSQLDFKVLIDVSLDEAFSRRLRRDLVERNYDKTEITHRYFNHAEPAFCRYIEPFSLEVDAIISNEGHVDSPIKEILGHIKDIRDKGEE